MGQVGIIANPASGKDIRRIVAYGSTFDNKEKVNIVRRLILSLVAVGVEKIIYMPEYYGIVPKAVDTISSQHRPVVEIVSAEMCMSAAQEDTALAAAIMADCELNCIITLGGDGTNRMVAKGCRNVPILPISTGTNNVFPTMIEGTIAGLAAGVIAQGIVAGAPAINPTKKLIVYKNGMPVDIALVDAVVLNDTFIGSRAVWDAQRISQIVVTRGEAHNMGISSIAGNLAPITAHEERGMVITIGSGNIRLKVPFAPGLLEEVVVQDYRYLQMDEVVDVTTPCMIALDGEREVDARPEDQVQIKLTFAGPNVINVAEALRAAVAKGYNCKKYNS